MLCRVREGVSVFFGGKGWCKSRQGEWLEGMVMETKRQLGLCTGRIKVALTLQTKKSVQAPVTAHGAWQNNYSGWRIEKVILTSLTSVMREKRLYISSAGCYIH
jgi:hypothetical protein